MEIEELKNIIKNNNDYVKEEGEGEIINININDVEDFNMDDDGILEIKFKNGNSKIYGEL